MKELLPEISYTAIDTGSLMIDEGVPDGLTTDMRVRSVSGILSDPTRYWSLSHSAELPAPCTVAEIIDSPGEWTAIASNKTGEKNQFLVFGDTSGFAPIFFSLLPGRAAVVSDTFSGAVQGVMNLGGKLTLNLENYLTLLGGKSPTFRNLVSTETMSNEIRILPHNKALYVSSNSVILLEREKLSGANIIQDYDSALDQGIEIASRSMKRLMTAHPGATPAITLTGGADSRSVFAILLTTGMAKEFGLWTIDPRERKSPYQKKVFTADIEIANELRHRYNLSWMSPLAREKISVSYEESLAYHQSFNSNFAFTFNPVSSISFNTRPAVTLRGGGGEILRGSGGARNAQSRYNKFVSEGGPEDIITWSVNHYLRGSIMSEESEVIAKEFISRNLSLCDGVNVREIVDTYYRHTRNRGHFGHARKSASANDMLMQSLTTPHLLRAMELLNYEDKDSGRLVIDILDRVDSQLRAVPFENPLTDAELRGTNQPPYRFLDRNGWESDYDKRGKAAVSSGFRPLWEPGARHEDWEASISQKNRDFIRFGFEQIVEMVSPEYREILIKQQRIVTDHIDRETIPAGPIASKVASALDVFFPLSLDTAGTHFYTDLGSTSIHPSSHLQFKGASYRTALAW